MYLQQLYPTPESVEQREGSFFFGAELVMETDAFLEKVEQERLQTLFCQFTFTASSLKILTNASNEQKEVHAVFSAGNHCSLNEAKVQSCDGDYRIQVLSNAVIIVAKNSKSMIDAFTTLVQLIEPENLSEGKEKFFIRGVEIADKGAMSFRSIHLCVFPETKPQDLQKVIRLAGFLKFTHVVLEFWGMYPYKTLPEMAWRGKAYSMETVNELVAEIRSFGMEPVPMLNHLGHASQSRACKGRHVVLDQAPRYAMLFEPDGWTWCISNPDTYKLLGDLRSELLETFGEGSYFHLGVDEAYSFATCSKCSRESGEKGRFLAEYLNRLSADIKKDGRRAIVWHDHFLASKNWPKEVVANGDKLHQTADAIDYLDRDLIIADWQYYDDFPDGEPTAEYFINKGFDVILCPWKSPENVKSLCNTAKRHGIMGIMATTWNTLPIYLPMMPKVAMMMWDSAIHENVPQAPRTESATLLRKLISGTNNYEDVGWIQSEIYPFDNC